MNLLIEGGNLTFLTGNMRPGHSLAWEKWVGKHVKLWLLTLTRRSMWICIWPWMCYIVLHMVALFMMFHSPLDTANNNSNDCGWAPCSVHCILSSRQQGHSEHPQPLLSRSSPWPSVNMLCWNSVILLSSPLRLSTVLSAVTKQSLAVFPTTFKCLLAPVSSGVRKNYQNGR